MRVSTAENIKPGSQSIGEHGMPPALRARSARRVALSQEDVSALRSPAQDPANRLKNAGSTIPQLEEDGAQFVASATGEVLRTLGRASHT
jgi:hypothetical protein